MSEFTNQKGFNLVELLVAMGILLAGTLAVASMLLTSSTNSMSSTQDRSGDQIALEIVEALKGEVAQTTFDELSSLQLKKPVPGSETSTSGPYLYLDSSGVTTGTVGPSGNFVQRTGQVYPGAGGATSGGATYIYKWRVEDRHTEYSLPDGMLKLEVTVGWNDKKYVGKFPCTGDPGNPGDPNRNCARVTKMTNWVIQSKN